MKSQVRVLAANNSCHAVGSDVVSKWRHLSPSFNPKLTIGGKRTVEWSIIEEDDGFK